VEDYSLVINAQTMLFSFSIRALLPRQTVAMGATAARDNVIIT